MTINYRLSTYSTLQSAVDAFEDAHSRMLTLACCQRGHEISYQIHRPVEGNHVARS